MDKFKKLIAQAVKFGLVGVVNTLVDTGVYSLLMLIPLFKQYYVVAQVLGYCAGVANSLVMNKRWTFSQKEPMTRRQLILFLLVNLAALGVSTGIPAGKSGDESLCGQDRCGGLLHGRQFPRQQADGV